MKKVFCVEKSEGNIVIQKILFLIYFDMKVKIDLIMRKWIDILITIWNIPSFLIIEINTAQWNTKQRFWKKCCKPDDMCSYKVNNRIIGQFFIVKKWLSLHCLLSKAFSVYATHENISHSFFNLVSCLSMV